jgi:hypothetical protein
MWAENADVIGSCDLCLWAATDTYLIDREAFAGQAAEARTGLSLDVDSHEFLASRMSHLHRELDLTARLAQAGAPAPFTAVEFLWWALIAHFERRGVFRPILAPIVEARGRDVGVA